MTHYFGWQEKKCGGGGDVRPFIDPFGSSLVDIPKLLT